MGDQELVTLAEAGRRAGLSSQRMSQLARREDFPAVRRIGAYRLVDAAEVKRWLADRPKPKGGRPRKRPRS